MSMDMVVKVILAILETFIFFGFGAWAYYLKMIEDKDLGKLGRLSIDMLLPFLTFSSVVKNFTAKDIGMIWQLPLIGLGIMAFGALCGYLLVYGLHDKSPRRNGTFIHLAIANNYIFLPLVVLGNLFGTKAVAALMLLSVGSTIGFWTFGVGVLAGRDFKRVFRNVCSTNMAAIVLALIFVFLGIQVPAFGMNIFEKLGTLAVPLSLLLIGASMYKTGIRMLVHRFDAVYTLIARLVIIPFFTVFLLKLLPLEPLVYHVALIVSLMPASCTSVLIVRKYGGCPDFAGQSVFFSTIACIVTVPVFLYFLM